MVENGLCYIDKRLCTGARFSFCGECKRAKKENKELIRAAKTPLELTVAHIPKDARKIF